MRVALALVGLLLAGCCAAAPFRAGAKGWVHSVNASVPLLQSSDPNVHPIDLPDHARKNMLAFEYGEPTPSSLVAVFDFDGTLGNPLICMGHRCPDRVWEGYREWSNTFAAQVRDNLAALVAQGYKIIIVSNQSPLLKDSTVRPELFGRDVDAHTPAEKQQQWLDKLTEFAQVLNSGAAGSTPSIPLQIFGLLDGTKVSGFYKPCAAWWELLASYLNGNTRQIDCRTSFFAGDAGGRLDGDTTNPWQNGTDKWEDGNWAASDRQFALSGGVQYKTPEQVFLGSAAPSADDYHKESFETVWCGRYTAKSWCA